MIPKLDGLHKITTNSNSDLQTNIKNSLSDKEKLRLKMNSMGLTHGKGKRKKKRK